MWIANHGDAVNFRNHLREKPPAVYNNARLTEKPLPNIDSDGDQDENAIENQVQNDENTENLVGLELNPDIDIENGGPNANIEQVLLLNDDLILNTNVIKEEMDPIAISEEDAAELSRILNEDSILSDENDSSELSYNGQKDANTNHSDSEDEAIIWEKTDIAFPMPAKCTEDIMPKRENDPISGEIPFAEKVVKRQIISSSNKSK